MKTRGTAGGLLARLLALCLGGAVAAGCGFTAEMTQTKGFSAPGTPYRAALDRYTRNAEIYRDLDAVAKAHATWKSPALRSALADASVEAYGLKGEAAEALRREEEKAGRRVREFHVALYTPKNSWNDLDSPETLWRAHVELPDGTRLDPVQIVVVSKSDKSPVQYPYVTPWTKEYSVVFPLLDETTAAANPSLVIEGPLGRMTFPF